MNVLNQSKIASCCCGILDLHGDSFSLKAHMYISRRQQAGAAQRTKEHQSSVKNTGLYSVIKRQYCWFATIKCHKRHSSPLWRSFFFSNDKCKHTLTQTNTLKAIRDFRLAVDYVSVFFLVTDHV